MSVLPVSAEDVGASVKQEGIGAIANADIERATRALLELIEADRSRRCEQILGEAMRRAQAQLAQARVAARTSLRDAFEEQRALYGQRCAAAHARLATRRRMHEQRRGSAALRLAWQELPGELRGLWQCQDRPADSAGLRAEWVGRAVAWARARLPRGAWRITHAPDWPAEQRDALAQALRTDPGVTVEFEADPRIVAGLRISAAGNTIDATLDGLLAERAEIEARLLRLLESEWSSA